MTILNNYQQFGGRHWETGSVHNFYAYRGVVAPHTNEPFSEALLLGISGGIVFGYFSFAYDGYDPFVALLTRNTFDPYDTMLSRLGVMQNVVRTAKPDKGIKNLQETLADGTPAIVLADYFSLDYNCTSMPEMWGMFPIVIYGLDDTTAYIADSAGVGLTASAEQLQAARGRVKKEKYQLSTLEAPDFGKLKTAVTAGIWDTIKLYTEKPPKGSKNNFGFAAYQQWIKLLTKPKQRLSWAKEFPAGRKLYSALTSTYERIATFGQAQSGAERSQYANFLDEASVILEKPVLNDAAKVFRQSAEAWTALEKIVLPDEVEVLAETRQLLEQRRDLFVQQGNGSIAERQAINTQLAHLKNEMEADFPLNQAEIEDLQQRLAAQVQVIHDIELEGVGLLKTAVSN
ncbi:MAG: BtrH N-terminal domain-containing protein [Chloroflexota bacterium]